tara:strand:+ start:58 stop:285 length:228 start_codon:yes stop_codon:yes gene_type:complete
MRLPLLKANRIRPPLNILFWLLAYIPAIAFLTYAESLVSNPPPHIPLETEAGHFGFSSNNHETKFNRRNALRVPD